jgi:hypothetical protein
MGGQTSELHLLRTTSARHKGGKQCGENGDWSTANSRVGNYHVSDGGTRGTDRQGQPAITSVEQDEDANRNQGEGAPPDGARPARIQGKHWNAREELTDRDNHRWAPGAEYRGTG